MKVELIAWTDSPLEMLIYTKETRLQGKRTLYDIMDMPFDDKMEIYEGMKDTIQSPFEFVDFTFNIDGVSRSFTHQLVRTRNASYAQESLRAVKPGGGTTHDDLTIAHHQEQAIREYNNLVEAGWEYQHAREMLPMGIHTNITAKFNLRELGLMAEKRLCTRTAGEYQEVFKLMKHEIVSHFPYFEDYLEVYCVKHGTCCFPRYTQCPIQSETVKITKKKKADIKLKWLETDHVADPSIR